MTGAISQDQENCQFPFLLDENPLLYRVARRESVGRRAKRWLSTMYTRKDYVESGGLMSYGSDLAEAYSRVVSMIDKILKGTHPVDIPVEQPKKFELVINLKAKGCQTDRPDDTPQCLGKSGQGH